jgi:hypothetical protein
MVDDITGNPVYVIPFARGTSRQAQWIGLIHLIKKETDRGIQQPCTLTNV